MEKYPDNFELEKKYEKNKSALIIEAKTLSQSGGYLELASAIEILSQKIELVDNEIIQKDKEIYDIEELIINNYINNNDIDDVSFIDKENKQLQSHKLKLEDEYLALNEKKEKIEDERSLLIKSN